jgi:hypothetical protein
MEVEIREVEHSNGRLFLYVSVKLEGETLEKRLRFRGSTQMVVALVVQHWVA